jgi:hypothetical protein
MVSSIWAPAVALAQQSFILLLSGVKAPTGRLLQRPLSLTCSQHPPHGLKCCPLCLRICVQIPLS